VKITYDDPDQAVLAHLTLHDHGIRCTLAYPAADSGDNVVVEVAGEDAERATDVLDQHGLDGDVEARETAG